MKMKVLLGTIFLALVVAIDCLTDSQTQCINNAFETQDLGPFSFINDVFEPCRDFMVSIKMC